jgi:hypothetical protein
LPTELSDPRTANKYAYADLNPVKGPAQNKCSNSRVCNPTLSVW